MPLEDLYLGWDQAGQVGQEVYGGAGAFVLTTYAYRTAPGLPFQVFSEYPIMHWEYNKETNEPGEIAFKLSGSPRLSCKFRIIPTERRKIRYRVVRLQEKSVKPIAGRALPNGHREFEVDGGSEIKIQFSRDSIRRTAKDRSRVRAARS